MEKLGATLIAFYSHAEWHRPFTDDEVAKKAENACRLMMSVSEFITKAVIRVQVAL